MNITDIARALGGKKSGTGYQCTCPAHEDKRASLSVSNGDKGVVFHCHAGCAQHDVLEALKSRGLWSGAGKQKPLIVETYDYRDEHGELVSQAVRYLPKDFRQRKPDGAGGWIWKMEGVARLPYRLPEVLAAIATGETVYIVEGEKDADNVRKLGLAGTCNAGGAGKWQAAHSQWLKGAKVIILPDNDDPGRAHAQQVAKSLAGIAAAVRIVELPGLSPKGDVSDWLAGGGTREAFDALVAAPATLPAHSAAEDRSTLDAQTIATLAALPALEYDRIRFAEAEKLGGVRVQTLDEEVARARGNSTDEGGLMFAEVEPWPDPVGGKELLDNLAASCKRFIVLPKHGDTVLALWVLFTHFMEAVDVAPILALLSPEKRCGKTTCLDWLSRLVQRPLPASNISPAALFRAVEAWGPTLLIDEADSFARENEELRGILNSGHTRTTAYVVRTVGDNHEPKAFSTWGAKLIALIGTLPDTLQERAIAVELRRKLRSERVEKLRHTESGGFEILARQCVRFAQDNAAKIRAARPKIPEELHDRAADNWEPLLSISDAAGDAWAKRAREAASVLSGASPDGDSTKTELLRDVQVALTGRFAGRDHVGSAELIEALTADPELRWCEFNRGKKPLTQRQLARLLRPFGIVSRTVRLDAETARGYPVKGFEDDFARYLPPFDPTQRHNPRLARVSGENASETANTVCRIENGDNPLIEKPCVAVSDENPPSGGKDGFEAF